MKIFLLISFITGIFPPKNLNYKPIPLYKKEVKIITQDYTNFWLAYEASLGKDKALQERIFDSIYIRNASDCLKKILITRNLTAAHFVKWVNHEADYFRKCKLVTDKISEYSKLINEYCEKFKSLYPKADIGDIYFMFTGFYTGGQSNKEGIAIGMDFWSLPDTGVVDFKTSLNKELVRKIEIMPITVMHEQIHRNQKISAENTLLKKCLEEGGADFIAYLITGKINNISLYDYGNNHNIELKARFIQDLSTNNMNYWLYNNYDSNRPRDLGYWIGFKICESFYNNAADKSRAVANILHIKKPERFLKKSNYLNAE